jgi:dolichyl-phosphate-mannose-protein mannosyltransferase
VVDLDRRDLLTIGVLCIVFFSLAVSNLGSTQTPVTTWQASGNKAFYVDLGTAQKVGTVYLLVQNGSANVQVYTGSPGNWNLQGSVNIVYPYAYYNWNETIINSNTRYVRFDFEQASVTIAELAVLSPDNQKLPITAVNSEGASDPNLQRLVDEQGKVQVPPTYMSETYFDEVYYVRTAENYLHLQYPYEWTHPPLGKLIIASGIVAFGYSPFGWRIMGVVFATLMIALIYVLGKKLFGTWIGGFASAFLLTFDFMHFTMARMATVDTYVVFFSLASQLFFLIYLKNVSKDGWKAPVLPLFLSFLFFALGFSTKWVVLYGFVGMLVILLALRLKEVRQLKGTLSKKLNAVLDHPFYLLPSFLLVAVGIYFLTYIPDMLAGRSFLDVLGLQGSMYIYHSTLVATHPFSSAWWSWPLMLKPLWLSGSSLPQNIRSTITLLGNPAVWWVGFASVIGVTAIAATSLLGRFRKQSAEKTPAADGVVGGFDLAAVFIAVVFFFQWLPYVLISRITFIYHFYVSVPFLCLASAYLINRYWSNRWVKVATAAFFAVVVLLFALFYPVISGVPTSNTQIDSLKWFGSWVF